MRPLPNQRIEHHRQLHLELQRFGCSHVGTNNGIFMARARSVVLRMISAVGEGWEHVSVSLENRCPTWYEMCIVKDLFWLEEETVMQLHPAASRHINIHPHCLHLWKPIGRVIDLPPPILV